MYIKHLTTTLTPLPLQIPTGGLRKITISVK